MYSNNKRTGYNRNANESNRNEKTQRAIDHVLTAFRSGDIPAAIVHTKFGIPGNIPMSQWSERNQFLAALNGTIDARGFQQWKTAGRSVKRGAKAFYILAPWTITKEVPELSETGKIIIDEKTNEPAKPKKTIVIGYYDVPVFRVEDTEGEPLKYDQLDERKFDLAPVARSWGIDIRQIEHTGGMNAYYSFGNNDDLYIAMAQDSEKTFCHELAHAAHHRLCYHDNLDFREIPSWEKEVVAELCSGALLYLIGKKPEIGNHYQYIERHAKDSGIDMFAACMKVTDTCRMVIDAIMTEAEKLQITETIAA